MSFPLGLIGEGGKRAKSTISSAVPSNTHNKLLLSKKTEREGVSLLSNIYSFNFFVRRKAQTVYKKCNQFFAGQISIEIANLPALSIPPLSLPTSLRPFQTLSKCYSSIPRSWTRPLSPPDGLHNDKGKKKRVRQTPVGAATTHNFASHFLYFIFALPRGPLFLFHSGFLSFF